MILRRVTRLFFFICLMQPLHAAVVMQQTSQQLQQLNQHADKIQHALSKEETKRQHIYLTIAATEKKIGEYIQLQHTQQQELNQQQKKINQLQQTILKLSNTLSSQQQALYQHLQARYHMSQASAWTWIYDQTNPHTINRLITYYQYVLRAEQHAIDQLRTTSAALTTHQHELKQAYEHLQQRQHVIEQQQQQLTHMQQHHRELIQTLNQTIQTKQQTLATYRRDKAHLEQLLTTLSAPLKAPARLLQSMRLSSGLSNPLQSRHASTELLNQGVLFLAPEGTPVSAVLPGKIIFSDWLNGYGLLIIIEHQAGTMSLYAHNQSLFKSKGALVKPGDIIATVGHTGGLRKNGLYFELRRRGKAIPPRQWLS